MAGPDLTAAVERVEALMDDECTIVHDAEGWSDDTFDPVTGTWIESAGTQVYSGRCFVSRRGGGSDTDDAGRPRAQTQVVVKVPLGTSAPPGSRLTITASARNSFLVGTRWRVIAEESSTFSVAHRVVAERLVDSLIEEA